MTTTATPETVAIQIVVRGDDLAAVDAARRRLGLSRATLLRAALRHFLETVEGAVDAEKLG